MCSVIFHQTKCSQFLTIASHICQNKSNVTYKSVFIRNIIGELEFMKSNGLAHPLLPFGRAVWVDVHALWHLRVSFSSHHPAGFVKLVAAVINGDNVHQQDILCCLVQPVYPHFERRKHPPVAENERNIDVITR